MDKNTSQKAQRSLDVKRYDESMADVWDDFVAKSINGTIFHRRRFLNYHPPERFDDHSLMFWKGDALVAVFPAARLNLDGKAVLKSHPGASYGGPVLPTRILTDGVDAILSHLIDYASSVGFEAIEFRPAPKIFNLHPCDQLEFLLLKHGFAAAYCELSTCYAAAPFDVSDAADDEKILATFSVSCRNQVRQAIRAGLEACLCNTKAEFGRFWEMLAENLKKHHAHPTHSSAELWNLKERFPEEIELLGICDGEKMVAGVVIFICNRSAAHTMYIAGEEDARKKRPVNLAIFESVKEICRRGLKYLNFGISTEDQGRVINWGLLRFKEGFSSCGTLRTYWKKSLERPPQ